MKSQEQFLNGCDALIAEAEKTLEKASAGLAEHTNRHIPSKLKEFYKIVKAYMDERITQSMYTKKKVTSSMFPVKKDGKSSLYVTISIRYSNLKLRSDTGAKENSNFAFKTFFVILTAVIDRETQKATYYITASPEFRIPGTYKPGQPLTDTNLLTVFKTVVGYYNLAMFRDRLPVPDHEKFEALVGLPNIQKVRVSNDRITLILKPNITEAQKTGAIGDVITLLKNTFGDSINFAVNAERSINLNEKVRVVDPMSMKNIKQFTGEIKTPLLNSDRAKIALNNDLDTFVFWGQTNLDAENAAKAKKVDRMNLLLRQLNKSPSFDEHNHSIEKGADKDVKDKFDEYRALKRRFDAGEFRASTSTTLKREYERYIKDGLKSGTIKTEPENSSVHYEVHRESHPVLHIELIGSKLSDKDKKKYLVTLRKFNKLVEECRLDRSDANELKKIIFKM